MFSEKDQLEMLKALTLEQVCSEAKQSQAQEEDSMCLEALPFEQPT